MVHWRQSAQQPRCCTDEQSGLMTFLSGPGQLRQRASTQSPVFNLELSFRLAPSRSSRTAARLLPVAEALGSIADRDDRLASWTVMPLRADGWVAIAVAVSQPVRAAALSGAMDGVGDSGGESCRRSGSGTASRPAIGIVNQRSGMRPFAGLVFAGERRSQSVEAWRWLRKPTWFVLTERPPHPPNSPDRIWLSASGRSPTCRSAASRCCRSPVAALSPFVCGRSNRRRPPTFPLPPSNRL